MHKYDQHFQKASVTTKQQNCQGPFLLWFKRSQNALSNISRQLSNMFQTFMKCYRHLSDLSHSASSSQACFFVNDMFSRGKICVRKLSFWKCLTLCILYFHICILWYLSTSPDTHCSILFLSFEQKIWLFIFCSSPIGTFIKAINSNSTSFVVSTFP